METAKHEEVAIYVINMRIPNGCRIVEVHSTKQSVGIINCQAGEQYERICEIR